MPSSNAYDAQIGAEEHILTLPDGRLLAYAHNGPPTSRTVILFFTGLMSVGTAAHVPRVCRSHDNMNAHWVAPTLLGMGLTSSRPAGVPYHETLARDMTALLAHLYPSGDGLDALYVAGGSYGTVPAQMLYGAPYKLFPAGRKIAGCVLLAGFSPFKYHTDHARALSWQTWFSIGPPSRLVPFHMLQRLFSTVLASKFKTVESAAAFYRTALLGKMDADERAVFERWLAQEGRTEDDVVTRFADGAVRSAKNWDGFLEVADVVHSDWGFEPAALDGEHASKPMLVVSSTGDEIGGSTSDWLVQNYEAAKLKVVPGGHISSLFYQEEIWRELFQGGWVE